MFTLTCHVQKYAWGKRGNESLVASLLKTADPDQCIDDSLRYAELWMGTHSSGPARTEDGELLSQVLKQNPHFVGGVPVDYPSDDLPFLFKVLSVDTALSIQAHPDKMLALQLHNQQPHHYKDANHKPEMIIALTDFECLCGFRPVAEIMDNFLLYPEFCDLMGGVDVNDSNESASLKKIFRAFVSADAAHCDDLQMRLKCRLHSKPQLSKLDTLLLKLIQQYPSDNGIFAPLLMNYMTLRKGESFYIGANILHAYISGDCIECMALSDNVVRAGLTPKHKDVATLCSMLSYSSGLPDFIIPEPLSDCSCIYRPPSNKCPEFAIESIVVPCGLYDLRILPFASIVLVLESEKASVICDNAKKPIRRGMSLFIAASTKVCLLVEQGVVNCQRAQSNILI